MYRVHYSSAVDITFFFSMVQIFEGIIIDKGK